MTQRSPAVPPAKLAQALGWSLSAVKAALDARANLELDAQGNIVGLGLTRCRAQRGSRAQCVYRLEYVQATRLSECLGAAVQGHGRPAACRLFR